MASLVILQSLFGVTSVSSNNLSYESYRILKLALKMYLTVLIIVWHLVSIILRNIYLYIYWVLKVLHTHIFPKPFISPRVGDFSEIFEIIVWFIFLSYAFYHILLLLLIFILKRSRIIFWIIKIQVLKDIVELYGILGRKMMSGPPPPGYMPYPYYHPMPPPPPPEGNE
jgi:hypothetical protein